MKNNQFPPLEPENSLPEVFPDIPERMEPLEEMPVIEELSFTQEVLPEEPANLSEKPVIADIPVMEEVYPEEIPVAEEASDVISEAPENPQQADIPEEPSEPDSP